MDSPLDQAIARYGPTAVGLVIGTLAKYGMTLSEGRKLTWVGVIADLFLLGMLGLIALTSGDVATLFGMHVAGDARILSGALAAVGSDRVVRLVRERYIRKLGGDAPETPMPMLPADTAAEIVSTPPKKPAVVQVVELPKKPQRRELRTAFKVDPNTPADMAETLRRLADPDAP